MFEVSWGELAVVTGIGLALIGRKDLPRAAYVAGTQVGRIVGLLQGARARADRFAEQSELRHLSNEFRSGLRELDAVRSELAVSMSAGSLVGGRHHLGATQAATSTFATNATHPSLRALPLPPTQLQVSSSPTLTSSTDGSGGIETTGTPSLDTFHQQATWQQSSAYQTTAAVAEQEWATRGIAFTSAAEQGRGVASASFNRDQSGSVRLAQLLQQSLIFDQYDRVVAEQDAVLQSKLASLLQSHQPVTASSIPPEMTTDKITK
jgi:Sec-independent protein translocase protein TatA